MYEYENIMKRIQWLTDMITDKKKALKGAPNGTLRAFQHGNSIQYYHRSSPDNSNGRYLKPSEEHLVRSLAQKEYDKRVINAAEKELGLLKRLNKLYLNDSVEDVYTRIPKVKQEKIDPVWQSDEIFVAQWLAEPYERNDYPIGNTDLYSDKGEHLRSKSEVIIANMLDRRNIPYKYECPLMLNGKNNIYPDFTVLNIRLRKELYWEHLGLLDNEEYLRKNLKKLTRYQMNGYLPGHHLILSYETSEEPLNMKFVEKLIEEYCI